MICKFELVKKFDFDPDPESDPELPWKSDPGPELPWKSDPGPELPVKSDPDLNKSFLIWQTGCFQDPLTVAWARENGVLPAGRTRDNGRGLLVITAVRAEDSGTYVCTATSGQFVATESAQLTVTGTHSLLFPLLLHLCSSQIQDTIAFNFRNIWEILKYLLISISCK